MQQRLRCARRKAYTPLYLCLEAHFAAVRLAPQLEQYLSGIQVKMMRMIQENVLEGVNKHQFFLIPMLNYDVSQI